MHARKPASFWRKNVTAVVILLRGLARMSCGNRLSNFRRFIILRSGKVFTSCNKDNSANFYGEKSAMKQSVFFLFFFVLLFLFFVLCFFDNKRKIVKSNLVLLVVFVPESEGLYYLAVADPGKPLPPPYFKTKLGPEGPKKNLFGDQAPLPLIYGSAWPPHPTPPPLSQGLHPTLSRITWHAGFNLYI